MSAGSSFQDRTLNKVALCSAVFAGFAYVGYSYAKTAFCRKIPSNLDGREGHEVSKSCVIFRRHSQTTQTDGLVGNLDFGGTYGRLIIKPKSVQERIRDLNMKAQQFADTFIAIQNGNSHAGQAMSRNSAIHSTNSLQCSPWHSPGVQSPLENKLLMSRSSENLTHYGHYPPPEGSPSRLGWSRKSLRRRRLEAGLDPDGESRKQRAEGEARDLYETAKEELIHRLESLNARGRVLTPFEAKSLVAILYSEDKSLVQRSLVTIANCAAFSVNLDFLREVGCIHRLTTLLQDDELQLAAVQTFGNVVLSEENIQHSKEAIPILTELVISTCPEDPLLLAVLVVLTNIATISEWHEMLCPLLHRLYSLVDCESVYVQLQSLRLLVNLSCNPLMVPSLLAAEGPMKMASLVSMTTDEAVLIRVLTLLATLAQSVASDSFNPSLDLPPEDKAASPDTIDVANDVANDKRRERYARLFGINIRERLTLQTCTLMEKHSDSDVRSQAKRLYEAMKE